MDLLQSKILADASGKDIEMTDKPLPDSFQYRDSWCSDAF